MRKIFLVLLFIPLLGHSQKKIITVIIDTIYSRNIPIDFDIFYSYGELYGYNLTDSSFNKKNITYSNNTMGFCGQIILNSDSSVIEIPIDNKYGFLELSNLSSLKDGDTLKISNIKLFESDIRDTTFTIIEYYKFQNDSISKKPYKLKINKKINKKIKVIPPPKNIEIYINSKCYSVQIKKKKFKDDICSYFHGQKPINSKSPRVKFFGWSGNTDWRYVGYLRL